MTSRVVVLALALAVSACGADEQPTAAGVDAGTPDAAHAGASCTDEPAACTLPPAAPTVPPNTSGTSTVIAVSRVFLDEQHGYNLDGLISQAGDANHCTLQPGGASTLMNDLPGGVDNQFALSLMPLIRTISETPGADASAAIADGRTTVLIALDNLRDAAEAPDQAGVRGALYTGADKGSSAAFDGTDMWPITADSVDDQQEPQLAFTDSYVNGGVWVSATRGILRVRLIVDGYVVDLPIQNPVVTMTLHGVGTTASATDGVIAGELDPEAFAAGLSPMGGCGMSWGVIVSQIRMSDDIMADGTNGDPTQSCDAISIGIGFEGRAVKLGAVAPPETPPPDPCAPRDTAPDRQSCGGLTSGAALSAGHC